METNQILRTAFGQRIRELRIKKGFSQEAFADECKLVRTYMSRIENGTANPSLEAAKVLADGLGVTLSELLEGL
ncbi:helix-turn-helix transcriptional regulator [Pseudomonas sp. PDM23]|uniref:helix-turn-helix domain-containing protein n=1 Tax=unclassified Pseudomonas TaxID=196821 RepID=UPI001782C92D|nr:MULTISPECIES: helix-turn-helix transcriptional regulator [unclassified Pseudomonas]MBD9577946.1 helix-turn-helix transcriptional regulator [Pseudomonas sp. PDM23]MBD9672504.1 helix-turn-helix transcriptional regulator [Pseudomonas sp. PDM21]